LEQTGSDKVEKFPYLGREKHPTGVERVLSPAFLAVLAGGKAGNRRERKLLLVFS